MIDSALQAWLVARSLARGLPKPVPDRGGYRVDTNSDSEVRRWVFAQIGPGLIELGRTVRLSRHFLKLCGSADDLLGALPDGWQPGAPGYFMIGDGWSAERSLPADYVIEVDRQEAVTAVRIISSSGEVAASGYAAETHDAFVYDRIVTAPAHRRKGLGGVLMQALRGARRNRHISELLVATEEGRALYETLGWRMLAPYSTASIPEP